MGLSDDEMKYTNDAIMDAALDYYADNASLEVMCQDMPADYSDATTDKGSGGVALGEDTPAFTGPEDGDSSGRKITIDALSDVSVDVTGICDHIALVDDANSDLLLAFPLPYESIEAVDTTDDIVTIAGDKSDDLGENDDVTIRNSTDNDGTYTAESVSVNGDGDTEVTLNESIDDSTADGYMVYGAFKVTEGGSADINSFSDEIADVS